MRDHLDRVHGGCEQSPEWRVYAQYRARYEWRREQLRRREAEVQQDPVALQNWPMERKSFADGVEQALRDWETLGHKSEVEAATAADGARPREG